MALYNIKIVGCERAFSLTITIDTTEPIIVGNVYFFSSTTDCSQSEAKGGIEVNQIAKPCFPSDCYVVDDFEIPGSGTPNAALIDSYGAGKIGCQECSIANANFIVFKNCFGGIGTIYIPINQISPTPSIDDVYFLDFLVSGFGGQPQQYQGCFTVVGFSILAGGEGETFLISSSGQTDCQTCIDNSPLVYEVVDCLTRNTFYVSLPTSGFENHLITYTDLAGLTQYCGVVGRTNQISPNILFVSDLGIPDETGVNCDDCLATSNEKKKLINCLGGPDQIVWASVLFETDNSTHLSNGDGCYRISADVVPPSEPITINELANFDPQQNCEDCLECYGLIYDYVTCEPIEVCGPINLINNGNSGLYRGRDFKIDSSNFAFIPFGDSNRIGKLDLTTLSIVAQSSSVLINPQSLDIDEINGVICVSNTNTFSSPNYNVTFFDYINLTLSFNIVINARQPWKIYFNTNDSCFYVTTKNTGFGPPPANSIFVYSGSSYNTMSFVTSFGFPLINYSDIIQVGSIIYVLNESNQTIERYNDAIGGWTFIATVFLTYIPKSFTYNSSNNTLYILTNTNIYIKYDVLSNTFSIINFSVSCLSCLEKIKYNSTTNRLYITDSCCNHLYEFDTITDTLLKTYTNLSNNNVNQVYGIDTNSSGETWFSSYFETFQLGCTTDFVSGQITSNELIELGETFFNPILSACCEVTNIESITETYFFGLTEFISTLHYQDCETCTGTTHQLFYCQSCDGFFDGILSSTGSTYQIGDFVRAQWGNSDFLCFEIVDNYTFAQYGQTLSFESNSVVYSSCEECSSGATLGLTIINCDTLVPQQVNVSLNSWLEITGFPYGLPNQVISDSNGICYQVVNACPIDNVNPPFEPSNFYINQLFCRLGESNRPLLPISAGTEYFACQVCCPCESGGTITQVSVPHPTWTDGNGRAVTLLDAVLIGGQNGLNN
jgi:hypothetical protein